MPCIPGPVSADPKKRCYFFLISLCSSPNWRFFPFRHCQIDRSPPPLLLFFLFSFTFSSSFGRLSLRQLSVSCFDSLCSFRASSHLSVFVVVLLLFVIWRWVHLQFSACVDWHPHHSSSESESELQSSPIIHD